MIDVQFLNDKASKMNLFLKKVEKIISMGKDSFISTPMYPDRTQYYLISAYNELEEIACHLLKEITGEKSKGNCVRKLSEEQIFSEKINRVLSDFSKYIADIMENRNSYSPEELFITAREIVKILRERFIKELAGVVKEIKEREPKLSVPVNLRKIQTHAKAVKSSVRKISNFLNFPKEEFINTPLFIDRARYFSVVLIDSSLWICRHILRKSGKKPRKDCFKQLVEEGIISEETEKHISQIAQLREVFADPSTEFDSEKLYRLLKENISHFLNFISEISRYLVKGRS
ncbi:DUF86 domain-containing protein [Persephonella atlantica]|uniref:DUF86 domain-containing protein n=1 Tax=Persephonella atlantica TaxID=2699429 RepID=A0ABS1GFX0_9AQUI|nr:HepT-like ribonuclease domain-containing protein [Persephonella atlantica]MBK3331775.1 DUF86 domain-containing protein [Persephonella atlantica]